MDYPKEYFYLAINRTHARITELNKEVKIYLIYFVTNKNNYYLLKGTKGKLGKSLKNDEINLSKIIQ